MFAMILQHFLWLGKTFAVCRRAVAQSLFENRAEVIAGRKAQLVSNICNGIICSLQKHLCPIHFLEGNVLSRSNSQFFFKFGFKTG